MSRICSVPFDAISLTTDADQDLFEMVGASGYPFRLLEFEFTSSLTTDERLRLRLLRRSTTGSGGSAATEVPLDGGNSTTIQTAVNYLVTTPGTAGAILKAFQWSELGPLQYKPLPESRIEVASGGRLCLHVDSATGGTRTVSGYVVWEEFG